MHLSQSPSHFSPLRCQRWACRLTLLGYSCLSMQQELKVGGLVLNWFHFIFVTFQEESFQTWK